MLGNITTVAGVACYRDCSSRRKSSIRVPESSPVLYCTSTCFSSWVYLHAISAAPHSIPSNSVHHAVLPCPAGAPKQSLGNVYGINIDGVNSTKQPMGDMVREASRGAGIHSIINTGYFRLEHEVLEGRDHPEMKARLAESSRSANFELTPFQVETIVRAVWRPRTTVKVDYTISHASRAGRDVSRRFNSPSSDMGSPVLIDLPPGTGKTVVCVLACFLVSLERRGEICSDLAARYSSYGLVEGSVSARKPHGGRVSMVFVPKHVHHQWMAAAGKALEILSIMYPDKRVVVRQNMKASKVARANLDAGIIICDSAAFGLAKALETETVYAALCFDESTENCDAKNNAVYSEVPHDLSYGRAVMISADFSKMADSNSKSSSRPGAMLRRIFGDASTTHVRRAVQSDLSHFTKGECDGGCKVAAVLTMNAVFPADKREEIVAACSDLLKGVSLYTFGIKYKKSVLEVRLHRGLRHLFRRGEDSFVATLSWCCVRTFPSR